MRKIFEIAILISVIVVLPGHLLASDATDYLSPSRLSFTEATWYNDDIIMYADQSIDDLIKKKKAVVFYLFEACLS